MAIISETYEEQIIRKDPYITQSSALEENSIYVDDRFDQDFIQILRNQPTINALGKRHRQQWKANFQNAQN